jgi:hypothetical protein
MSNKTLEKASVSLESPLLGNIKGHFFPRAFEKRGQSLYLGTFDEEFKE